MSKLKRGRKPLPKSQRRDVRVSVFLNAKEAALINKATNEPGPFLREAGLKAATPTEP